MKKLFLIGSFATMLLATGCNNLDPNSVTNSVYRVYEDDNFDYEGNVDYNYDDNLGYDYTSGLDVNEKAIYNSTYDYATNENYKDTSYYKMYGDKNYYNTYDASVAKDYVENYDTYWNNQSEKTYLLDTNKYVDEN